MDTPISFKLENPIQRSVNGLLEDVYLLELVGPSKKVLRKTYRLQQIVTKALIESQAVFQKIAGDKKDLAEEEGTTGAGKEMDPKTLMSMLLASEQDIEVCLKEFEKLALLGCVFVDELKLNKRQLDEIDDLELEAMMSSYLANFILPLVMKALEQS